MCHFRKNVSVCKCSIFVVCFIICLIVLLIVLMFGSVCWPSFLIPVWTKLEFEKMNKVEHEREISVLETEIQEVKRKNIDLNDNVQALFKEIRRLSDSILPQELEIVTLQKQKECLEKINRNLLQTMEDIINELPKFCRVFYNEYSDGTITLDLRPLD